MRKQIIKESDLFELCEKLNSATHNPPYRKAYTVGTYRIGMAYSAYRLERILSTGGRIETHGPNYGSKREVFEFMQRFINQVGE